MTPVHVDSALLTTFLLVLARTTTWSVTTPILSTRQLAPVARLGFGVALAVFLTPLADGTQAPADLSGFVLALGLQSLIGLALGFLTGLLLTAVEMAGQLADFSSGFSYGQMVDPVSGSSSAAFARLANIMMLALLFATDGAAAIVAGFVRSFTTLPLGTAPHLAADGAALLGHVLGQTMLMAVEIGAPLIGVIFLTDVGLALVSRVVPQSNILNVGLSLKALAAFAAIGTVLTLLPSQLEGLVGPATRLGPTVLTGGAS